MKIVLNKKTDVHSESGKFIPRRKMGAFETGIYRSLRCVAHSPSSYRTYPYSI